MMEKMKKLVEEGQRLAEKRSWLRKGFGELFEKVNLELSKIPSINEEPIIYRLLEKPDNAYIDDIGDKYINVVMYFESDAYIVLRKAINCGGELEYFNVDTSEIEIETIREFGAKLPACFAHFLEVIEKRNKINQKAIETFSVLSKKLA